ncbi:MAG: T9SS type A sorting domain-containing protein [Pricia sp.]
MKKYLSFILLLVIVGVGNAQSGTAKLELPAKTEVPAKAKVKIFPNPATNVVNVLGLKNAAKADISVLDIYGNTLLNFQWAIRRNALNIPISELGSGAYIIHIHSEVEHIRTKFYKK